MVVNVWVKLRLNLWLSYGWVGMWWLKTIDNKNACIELRNDNNALSLIYAFFALQVDNKSVCIESAFFGAIKK